MDLARLGGVASAENLAQDVVGTGVNCIALFRPAINHEWARLYCAGAASSADFLVYYQSDTAPSPQLKSLARRFSL